MAKLADAQDLKSWDPKWSCGFDPHPRHQLFRKFSSLSAAACKLQGSELKGKNLLKHASGRKAASAVIKELGDRSQVVVVHKRYALACKLFEYTFEPLISDVSMALYLVNFHKFIANLLYLSSVAHHSRAITFRRFRRAVRRSLSSHRVHRKGARRNAEIARPARRERQKGCQEFRGRKDFATVHLTAWSRL